jgi:predicted GIY-YIG superfamily endonuclease
MSECDEANGRQTHLYRHYAEDGTLLYVGISVNAFKRLIDHKMHSAWFAQIETVKIKRYPTRMAAIQAETEAIQNEKPLYNIRKKLPDITEYDELKSEFFDSSIKRAREGLYSETIKLKPVYSLEEAGKMLDMSASSVVDLIKKGLLSAFQFSSYQRRGNNGKIVNYRRYKVSGWAIIDYVQSEQDRISRQMVIEKRVNVS